MGVTQGIRMGVSSKPSRDALLRVSASFVPTRDALLHIKVACGEEPAEGWCFSRQNVVESAKKSQRG